MSDAESETRQPVRHPSAFEPAVLAVTVVSSVVGAIIGVQIITTLGITPNTAIIGVLAAIAISRIPVHVFSRFRSIHRQNLVQTTISTATFAAANSLLLPIGIPVLLNRPDLVVPMLIGATLAMVIDLLMLYWLFDSRLFAATNAWPPGFAASEAVKAGDEGGKRARLLVYGGGIGVLGAWLGIPMSAFGVAFIGNIFALAMFGVGLVIRGYSPDVLGIDIAAQYIPHGMMIGAGVVALGQAVYLVVRAGRSRLRAEAGEQSGDADAPQNPPSGHAVTDETHTRSDRDLAKGIGRGAVLFLLAGLILAAAGGLAAQMPAGAFVGWMAFAAVSCIAAEFIVGLSAMHSGWFPAFATSLTFLVLGILMGFPPVAVALLVGFVAAGGPAFADGGYDLKAGWELRGKGRDIAFELAGRRQQLYAGLIGMAVALIVVAMSHDIFFANNLFPPIDRVYVATIKAGVEPGVITNLLLWALPGAAIQLAGGPNRQMGILLATGLLISSPLAGWAVLAGLVIRLVILRFKGAEAVTPMTIMAAGVIAGDALYSFGSSIGQAVWRR